MRKWTWRILCLALLGSAFVFRREVARIDRVAADEHRVETRRFVEEERVDPELAAFADALLDPPASESPRRSVLDAFETETDPAKLGPMAVDLIAGLDAADERRMIEIARSGDALHQEHALVALLGHGSPDAIGAMLALADPVYPPAVADRALDALLSVAPSLDGAQQEEARARARLLADRGEPSAQATALLLLTELGIETEDGGRFETLAHHPDPRVSLAAKRALFEQARVRGEHDFAQRIWESLPREENP